MQAVESGEAGLAALEGRRYDLVLLDVWLPGLDGLETLSRLRILDAEVPVIVISGHGNIETAVKAVRMGAQDFVEKPLSLEKTLLVVKNALRARRLEVENRSLKEQVEQRFVMVGESPALHRLRAEIAQAAPSNGRGLIFGENGTGKELVARNIHHQSRRAAGPFVEVNCAAIPEDLIESELFGHTKGAFTGALAARKGKFELADGGTLFLDEIGDMTLKTQAKVLRVLQEQKVEPVGGTASVTVDVRVIAATNKNLEDEIRRGTFREDLYFRLNVIPIHVPPLRERRDDIPLLARHFMPHPGRGVRPPPEGAFAGGARRPSGPALARQRPRAAQHHRAARDHDPRRAHRARAPSRDPALGSPGPGFGRGGRRGARPATFPRSSTRATTSRSATSGGSTRSAAAT